MEREGEDNRWKKIKKEREEGTGSSAGCDETIWYLQSCLQDLFSIMGGTAGIIQARIIS